MTNFADFFVVIYLHIPFFGVIMHMYLLFIGRELS